MLAGFALRAVFPTDVWQSVNLGTPAVAADISFGTAVLIEAILTFILVIAVFGTAMDPRAAKVGGFAIGLTIAADILIGGPLTGAAMNPARTFGPAVAANFWDNHLVYWIGPLCGAIVAGPGLRVVSHGHQAGRRRCLSFCGLYGRIRSRIDCEQLHKLFLARLLHWIDFAWRISLSQRRAKRSVAS